MKDNWIDEDKAFEWFNGKLNEKEKSNVFTLLGLSNSDIEVGEGKSIISNLINSNEIKSVCKEVGVLWDKEDMTHPFKMKNGVTVYSVMGKDIGGRAVICSNCDECRYYHGCGDGSYKCPVCGYYVEPPVRDNRSKGEELIERLLTEKGIDFKREVCEFKSYRYDFIAYVDNVKYFLEIHGRQHFEPVEYFGGEKYLSTLQKSDMEKMKYAEENGIYIMFDYRNGDLKKLRKDFKEKFINKYLNMEGVVIQCKNI